VIPSTASDSVTGDLVIDKYLRGKMANLKPGDDVVYTIQEDGSGLIIKRVDGEWDGTINGSVHLVKGKDEKDHLTMDAGDFTITEGNAYLDKGNLELKNGNETLDRGNIEVKDGNIILHGNLIVEGDIQLTGNMTATGNITANGSITADGSVTGQSVTSLSSVNAVSMSASGSINATGNVSAADVNSSGATLNAVNSDLQTFKTTYAAHTHTTPSGESGPPVG